MIVKPINNSINANKLTNLSTKNFGKCLIMYEAVKVIHPVAFSKESSLIEDIAKIRKIKALANPYIDGVYKKNIIL
ncbi:MAG: hypothetical protein FI675_00550 [SAR202 cluster bacterium]|nr:hypothetical protein [SAR202 cluster bacterium]|tara:strand:- start:2031 stop:2258 length:228 start_codon:yes stop_codon:yes gene_type:complete